MTRTLRSTPAADGFRMPAEFAAHEGCWMLWPERPDNWRRHAQPAQQAFAAVAGAVARFEPVTVGASAAAYASARAQLPAAVRLVELSSNDAWMRDVGPSFLVDAGGRVRGTQWRFNAWGGLYRDFARDACVAQKVLELAGCERYCAPLVTEGGALHVDGQGTVLVTEESLLDERRNPSLGRARVERLLKGYLGATQVIWLGRGVLDDETRGHIDNLACFARPGEVCLTWPEDARDPQRRICEDALQRLLSARDARGRRLRVHRIPAPPALYLSAREARGILPRPGIRPLRAGQRLAGSYINFYLANGALILPLLDAATDARARRALQRVFPARHIVGVPAREILLGGGNIHCITQQQPRAAQARLRTGRRARARP
ncbi:MAG TPA: agmatine deiminase [Steroidobacteraceae bacterium]|nr:agmatine deiminase [Steroidobacteraceae bacterium]